LKIALILLATVIVLGLGSVTALRLWRMAIVPADAPVIGLSLDTAWHSQIGLSSNTYEIALARAGARVETIRPGELTAGQILDTIDALILSGGGDVDPTLSAVDAEDAKLVDRERDDLELNLIRGALERDMPILGICRGVQILNVAHGGTLRSLRDDDATLDRHGVTLNSLSAHTVTIYEDSLLGRIIGVSEMSVNSMHTQAVDTVGNGLRVVATAEDGLVEGLERPDRRFVVAMQWHPEVLSLQDADALVIFDTLVEEARAYRSLR
jgi:gamma-glutamyl-gamma-aminobutyrate hydrolase PuuD